MNQDEIKAVFDQQAASYDVQWAKTAAIKDCLYLLLESLFAELPADARILCVGVGTGAELAHLARKNPAWRFTAVEPSGPMLDGCRQRAEEDGFTSRCYFHEGYLDSLPAIGPLAFWCLNSFSTSKRDQGSFGKYLANSSREEFLLVLIWLRMWHRQNMKCCFAPG